MESAENKPFVLTCRCRPSSFSTQVSNLVAMKEAGVRKAGYMAAYLEGRWRQRYCLLWHGLLMFFKHHTAAVQTCGSLKAVVEKVKGLSAEEAFDLLKEEVYEFSAAESPMVIQLPSTCSVTDGVFATKDFPVSFVCPVCAPKSEADTVHRPVRRTGARHRARTCFHPG